MITKVMEAPPDGASLGAVLRASGALFTLASLKRLTPTAFNRAVAHRGQASNPKLEIKGKLGDRLLVRQIVHLLENQTPQGGVQLFGRTAEPLRVAGGALPGWLAGKDMLPEQTGPGSVQQFASFGAQIVPGADQAGRFVIADMNHGSVTYLMNI